MELTELQPDEEKVNGVWIDYGDEASFLIASSESEAYTKAQAKIAKKYPPHKVRKDLKTQTDIAIEASAQALLLDFKGVTENGKAMKNTIENRRKILQTAELRNWIANQATDISNFNAEAETEDVADLKREP